MRHAPIDNPAVSLSVEYSSMSYMRLAKSGLVGSRKCIQCNLPATPSSCTARRLCWLQYAKLQLSAFEDTFGRYNAQAIAYLGITLMLFK